MTTSDPSVPVRRLFSTLAMTALILMGGCSPAISRPFESQGDGLDAGDLRLDHGYGLLIPLLEDESELAGILVIKSPRKPVADLIRRISDEAKQDLARLGPVLGESPVVNRSRDGLPVIEADARTRIRDAQTGVLVFSSGRTFELRILLTQEKATGYVAALATSLSKADPQEMRGELLARMADRWDALGEEVRNLLEVVSPEAETGEDGG